MDTTQLEFNLIYTPHTVRYLSPFVHRLLQFSDCRYRIVSNGCDADEKSLLQDLCEQHERLTYLEYPTDRMLEHGILLDWLHERTASPWFCFLDSDILAVDNFMPRLAAQLARCDVFASGHPLWVAPEDIVLPTDFKRLHGSHFETADGLVVGGTYFAVYNNELLTRVKKESGISFKTHRWDEVPAAVQRVLVDVGLEKMEYDTGLVLTGLLHAAGARFAVEDMPEIRHLGGFSARAGDGPATWSRGWPDRIVYKLPFRPLSVPLLALNDIGYALTQPSPGLTPEQTRTLSFRERRVLQSRVRKRMYTARYFNVLMRQLMRGGRLPALPRLGYSPADRRMAAITTQIIALYDELGLRGSEAA